MIEEIKEIGTSIKSVIDKQEKNEKVVDKLKYEQTIMSDQIQEMKAKAGRIGQGSGNSEVSFKDEFSRSLMEHSDDVARLARDGKSGFAFDMKAVGNMSFGVNFANASSSVATVSQGIVGAAARPVHVRDLLPTAPMSGSSFVFLKETGTQGAPAMVSEGATKPQVDFTLTETTVPAQVLAAWLVISNQMLEDVGSLNAFLGNRLLERLLVVEDNQLLSGSGTPPNLSGINTAGNFTAASGAATIDIEQLVQGIGQLAALGRTPSGIILSPTDYFALALNKAATSGDYSLPAMVAVRPDGGVTVAGVPAIWTAEQATGTFTIGDFNNGTLLLFRNTPRIEFFTDATLAKNNQTLVRIEERLALAIYGSTYIVKGTF